MALYKHTISQQTNRLIEWFKDSEGNHKIRITIGGKYTDFFYKGTCYANRQYEHLAAL